MASLRPGRPERKGILPRGGRGPGRYGEQPGVGAAGTGRFSLTSTIRRSSAAQTPIMRRIQRLTAITEREDDGFVSLCPELDIASQSATVEEARANLLETLPLFFETADPSEVTRRYHGDVIVTRVEVPAGRSRALSGAGVCRSRRSVEHDPVNLGCRGRFSTRGADRPDKGHPPDSSRHPPVARRLRPIALAGSAGDGISRCYAGSAACCS